jgi:hypothetical protein
MQALDVDAFPRCEADPPLLVVDQPAFGVRLAIRFTRRMSSVSWPLLRSFANVVWSAVLPNGSGTVEVAGCGVPVQRAEHPC